MKLTRKIILRFYNDVRLGVYRGRDYERNAIERAIFVERSHLTIWEDDLHDETGKRRTA